MAVPQSAPKCRTEPFRDFSVSLETLREEADRALGFNADWSYERFLEEMSLDESRATAEASVQSLLLERDGEDLFSVASFDAPCFSRRRTSVKGFTN